MSGARPSIVTSHEKPIVAKRRHHVHLILGHGAKRVVNVVLAAIRWTDAIAITAEVDGNLSEFGLVIDFKMVKPIIKELCDHLDEHWLIPGEHRELRYKHRDDGHTEVVYRECRYLAPTSEIIVMPINNTSAENFAAWVGRSLYKRLQESFGKLSVHRLRVTVSETSGQAGVYTYSDG